MALIEQAPETMNRERMLSLLKSLRDDLRQVIDQGAGEGNPLPDTPVQWLAPLRHRFTRILDELDVSAQLAGARRLGAAGRRAQRPAMPGADAHS